MHVGPTAEVKHADCGRYSMPPEAAGIPGTMYLYEDRVRIVAGGHVRVHDRVGPGRKAMDPADRAARLAAVSARRARSYQAREDLLDLGEPAFAFFTEIVHRPGPWQAVVLELHARLQRYGPAAMTRAFSIAVRRRDFSLAAIDQVLLQPTLFPVEVGCTRPEPPSPSSPPTWIWTPSASASRWQHPPRLARAGGSLNAGLRPLDRSSSLGKHSAPTRASPLPAAFTMLTSDRHQ